MKKCRAKIVQHLSNLENSDINVFDKLKNGDISREEYDSFQDGVNKNRERIVKSQKDFLENNPNEKIGSDRFNNEIQECIYDIFRESYIEKCGWSASRAKEYIDCQRARHQENKRMIDACTPVCTCHESME